MNRDRTDYECIREKLFGAVSGKSCCKPTTSAAVCAHEAIILTDFRGVREKEKATYNGLVCISSSERQGDKVDHELSSAVS